MRWPFVSWQTGVLVPTGIAKVDTTLDAQGELIRVSQWICVSTKHNAKNHSNAANRPHHQRRCDQIVRHLECRLAYHHLMVRNLTQTSPAALSASRASDTRAFERNNLK
jgi:hypothetical protein